MRKKRKRDETTQNIEKKESHPAQNKYQKLPSFMFHYISLYLNNGDLDAAVLICSHWTSIIEKPDFLKFYCSNYYEEITRKFLIVDYARDYARKMHTLFNKKAIDGLREENIDETRIDQENKKNVEELENILIAMPTHLQIPMIEQFFVLYTNFNLEVDVTVVGEFSLPIVLHRCMLTEALEWVKTMFKKLEVKLPPSEQKKIFQNSGGIFTTLKELENAQTYAMKLFQLFDEKNFKGKEHNEIKHFSDKIMDLLRKPFPPGMEVIMIKEFLILFPQFDIKEETTGFDQISLPMVLFECQKLTALDYLLVRQFYDEKCPYGIKNLSLYDLIIDAPPPPPPPKERRTFFRLSTPVIPYPVSCLRKPRVPTVPCHFTPVRC